LILIDLGRASAAWVAPSWRKRSMCEDSPDLDDPQDLVNLVNAINEHCARSTRS
jgi:hypothetical protein